MNKFLQDPTTSNISYTGRALDIELNRDPNILGSIPVQDTFIHLIF